MCDLFSLPNHWTNQAKINLVCGLQYLVENYSLHVGVVKGVVFHNHTHTHKKLFCCQKLINGPIGSNLAFGFKVSA